MLVAERTKAAAAAAVATADAAEREGTRVMTVSRECGLLQTTSVCFRSSVDAMFP